MLESSKDVLYMVLSFCILWLTVFLCWALYHAIKLIKNSDGMVTETREKFNDWSQTVDLLQDKIEDGIQALTLISASTKSIISLLGMLTGGGKGRKKKVLDED